MHIDSLSQKLPTERIRAVDAVLPARTASQFGGKTIYGVSVPGAVAWRTNVACHPQRAFGEPNIPFKEFTRCKLLQVGRLTGRYGQPHKVVHRRSPLRVLMTFNLLLRSHRTDAYDRLRARGVCPALVQRIHCRMDSLVLESTGKKAPASGLQAKPRACYGGAADLTVGRNAEKDISDLVVNRENMVVLCCKVAATGDVSIGEASVDVTATRTDGRTVREFVEHAIGSLKSPMTDALLETKLQSPAPLVLRSAQTMALAAARGAIGAANSVRTVVGLSSPTA